MALRGHRLDNVRDGGVDGCMANKALKTQGTPVGTQKQMAGDIEYLFKLYLEVSERVDVLEDEAKALDECYVNEDLDDLVTEAMAARPWYAKVRAWLRDGDNGLAVASIGVATAFVVAIIALVA